jgi:hypothetical protein
MLFPSKQPETSSQETASTTSFPPQPGDCEIVIALPVLSATVCSEEQ